MNNKQLREQKMAKKNLNALNAGLYADYKIRLSDYLDILVYGIGFTLCIPTCVGGVILIVASSQMIGVDAAVTGVKILRNHLKIRKLN